MEETVSDSDDGCGGRSGTDIEDESVSVDREGLAFRGDFSRLVSSESGSGFGNGLNNVDSGFLGGSEESVGLSRGEGGGNGEDCIGDWSTEEIGSVREEDSEESNDNFVNGEGGGLVVDRDGEGRLTVRVDNGSRVAGLLGVLYLVVAKFAN